MFVENAIKLKSTCGKESRVEIENGMILTETTELATSARRSPDLKIIPFLVLLPLDVLCILPSAHNHRFMVCAKTNFRRRRRQFS